MSIEFEEQTLLEIEHILGSGVNEIRLSEMIKRRCEAYHKHKVEAITDEEILECVKHSANGITVYRDGVSSIRNFKNKLLKK